MENNNLYSEKQYIESIGHPRKKELAELILSGATLEELQEKGFSKINAQESLKAIKLNVAGKEDLKIGSSVEEEDTTEETTDTTDENVGEEKKEEAESLDQVPQNDSEVTEPQAGVDVAPGQDQSVETPGPVEPKPGQPGTVHVEEEERKIG